MQAQQVGPADDHNWTYYGSNNDVPNILVFRPTWEEFKDFNKYMKYVESVGAYKAGIAKSSLLKSGFHEKMGIIWTKL